MSIDLLFARLVHPLNKEISEAVKEDEILRDMDDKSVRCINGYRVADQILNLVPNQEAFRETLRFAPRASDIKSFRVVYIASRF